MRIRKGDLVVVLTGDDSGPGHHKVIQVLDGGRKVMVEGVGSVFKHVRRGTPKSPSGGRLSRDMPIDSSNVALYCSSCHKATRIGYRFTQDGGKERFCKKCGASAGVVGAARKKKAGA